MPVIYSQNFDGVTPPALPSGWDAASGTWITTATDPVSSPNALVCSPATDGSVILIESISAMADMELYYELYLQDGFVSPILRMDSGYQNGYLINAYDDTLGIFNLYKRVSGSFTQIAGMGGFAGGRPAVGTVMAVRANITGSVISFKIWQKNAGEPGSWTGQHTDTSLSTAGFAGFYNNVPTTGLTTVDNVTLNNLATLTASPASVTESTTGNSLTLTGTETAWTVGTPGSPTFTASAGTITAQTVSSATTATLTYSAPGSMGSVTITDPSTTATASLTINSPSYATDFSITPSSQTTTAGSATGNYTVTPNGAPSSSTSIAFSDNGAGGTFTPSSLIFTTASPQTFTYTPSGSASPGTITLKGTASGGFSTNHSVSCVVTTGSQTIAVTNANLFWSPGNWDHLTSGTFGVSTETMQATAPGAYLKFNVIGTVNLKVNIDNTTNSGFPSGDMPIVRYSIDNAAFTDVQLAPSQTQLVLSSGLTTASHAVEIYFKASSNTNGYGDVAGSSGVRA